MSLKEQISNEENLTFNQESSSSSENNKRPLRIKQTTDEKFNIEKKCYSKI